jgi:hypothetical protein
MIRVALGISLSPLVTSFAFAQSDPQTLAFAVPVMNVLTGGTAITDANASGSFARTAASDRKLGSDKLGLCEENSFHDVGGKHKGGKYCRSR